MQQIWHNQAINIKIDTKERTIVGKICSISDRDVSFTGKEVDELEKNFLLALDNYKNNPSYYPKKDQESQIIDKFSIQRSQLRNFLTVEEIDHLADIRFEQNFHPTYTVIYDFERGPSLGGTRAPFQIAYNTDNSIKYIAAYKPEMIESLKERLLDATDYSNASSALAEIRAFCSLGFTKLNPSALPTKAQDGIEVADFFLKLNDQEVLIEVCTRISGKQHEQVIDWQEKPRENVRIEKIVSIAPFGHGDPSKQNEGITTNVISKICAIKQHEGQFHDDTINVLWIDLQDTKTMLFSCGVDHCLPFFTHSQPDNLPNTGNFWHAFYGRKGEKVLETVGTLRFKIQFMMHHGRFINKSKINFAVISLPERIVVFENPNRTQMKNIEMIRQGFYLMPNFSAEHSLLELQPGYLDKMLIHQRIARNYCYEAFTR
jgi:hypothetical protein